MKFPAEHHNCPFCNVPLVLFSMQKTESVVNTAVYYCPECRCGMTLPSPDDDTLHELHSTQYYRNGEGIRFTLPIEWLVEGMRRWRVHRLSGVVARGRALDIGCGSGKFLRALRDIGWDVAGLELNDDTATGARVVHTIRVEVNLNAFTENTFELITITHVLEHIRDPRQMLIDCCRLLKPGGVIAVAVPNIESWQARLTRGNWFHLDLPRHLWHFSEAWLSRSLCELGFEPIMVRRLDFAHNTFGWLQSILNCIGLRHNRLYSFLSSNDLETDNRACYISLFISLIIAPVLLPFSMLLSVLEVVFCASGTVEVIARRIKVEPGSERNSV